MYVHICKCIFICLFISFLIVRAVLSPSANRSPRPEGCVSSLSLRGSWDDALSSPSVKRRTLSPLREGSGEKRPSFL